MRRSLPAAIGSIAVCNAAFLLVAIVSAEPAWADVALCPSFPPPASDAMALRRAPIAFEGVVIRERRIQGPRYGIEFVSPLTFRVSRWMKRGSAGVVTLPDGAQGVELWDGRYARLPDRILTRYSTRVERRFPGEIEARHGQHWRIFATNENGVNFTCTNLLGSHPLESPSSTSHPSPRAQSRAVGSRSHAPWSLIWALVLLGAAGVATLAWVMTKRPARQ